MSVLRCGAVQGDAVNTAILSVDPGNNSGWAMFIGGNFRKSGVIPPAERAGIGKSMDVLEAFRLTRQLGDFQVPPGSGRLMVIESQYTQVRAAASGMLKTVESRATWEAIATLLGWEILRVPPSTWQSHAGLLKKAVNAGRRAGGRGSRVEKLKETEKEKRSRLGKERRARKKLSVVYAQKIKPTVKSNDEADAILIGRWAVLRERIQEAAARGRQR